MLSLIDWEGIHCYHRSMATIAIYGASDDLIEVEGDIDGADEYNLGSTETWTGVLEAPDGETALVYVTYQKNGCWTVAFGQYDIDYKLPAWQQEYSVYDDGRPNREKYSVQLTLTVPDGTTIRPHTGS